MFYLTCNVSNEITVFQGRDGLKGALEEIYGKHIVDPRVPPLLTAFSRGEETQALQEHLKITITEV